MSSENPAAKKISGLMLLIMAAVVLIVIGIMFGIVAVLHLAVLLWYVIIGIIALIMILPLSIGGAVLYRQGNAVDQAAKTENKREQEVLKLLSAEPEIKVTDLATRLEVEPVAVKRYVQEAAGRGSFSGYADWKGGTIYARSADSFTDKCPRCGGKRPIAGKTRVVCPFCGTETFLANPTTVKNT